MGRHHDQVSLLRLGRLENCLNRIAFEQPASDDKAFELQPESRVPVLLRFSKCLCEQIPTSQFEAVFGHTGGTALRGHHVQHRNLRMEMVG